VDLKSAKTVIQNLWKKRVVRAVVGLVIGAVAGYVYYRLIGCRTGSCSITSRPVVTTLLGAISGLAITAW
jgi:hypothetical protein